MKYPAIAIAKETMSMGRMVNKGQKFYVRKGSLGRVKLCTSNTNSAMFVEIPLDALYHGFEIQEF